MKLEHADKSRRFTQRLLNDFSTALFELLREKKLESVTVAELCAKASYPRSTFYNYFEDIYALTDYCWDFICAQMKLDEFRAIDHGERTLELFGRVYDYLEEHRGAIGKLLEHNRAEGALALSLDRAVRRTISEMVNGCELASKYPVPADIMAQHYGNTVQMILSACFRDEAITKQEAMTYLDFLLGTLEKANAPE